jgi:hypothetical protein
VMNSRRCMSAPMLRRWHLNGQTIALIRAEIGIKTIAAVHSQCRLWVKSGQTVAGQNPTLSALIQ